MTRKNTFPNRCIASAALVAVLVSLDDVRASENLQDSVRLGTHWYGEEVELDDLRGRVVMIENWGYNCGPCRASLPVLAKLHKEHEKEGFLIIGNHVQNEPEEKVVALVEEAGVEYPIFSFSNVNLPREGNTIPYAWLFDGRGRLVDYGHPSKLEKVAVELVRSEPHWILRGQELEHLSEIGQELKKARRWTPIVERMREEYEKGGEVAKEAAYVGKAIEGYGKYRLRRAHELEKADPTRALAEYKDIASVYDGHEVGDKADERLAHLKKDDAFRDELEAEALAQKIRHELGKLIRVQGKTPLDYGPNKRIAARAMAMYKALHKKFEICAATAKVREFMERKGFDFDLS